MIGSLPPADLALVFRMMALLALGTWAARPLAQRLVPGGGGWCPAVLIGWTIMGWVPWACAAVGLIAFEAAALAGLQEAVSQGLVRAGETVVVINTGSGLKDVKAAMQVTGSVRVIAPALAAVREALGV